MAYSGYQTPPRFYQPQPRAVYPGQDIIKTVYDKLDAICTKLDTIAEYILEDGGSDDVSGGSGQSESDLMDGEPIDIPRLEPTARQGLSRSDPTTAVVRTAGLTSGYVPSSDQQPVSALQAKMENMVRSIALQEKPKRKRAPKKVAPAFISESSTASVEPNREALTYAQACIKEAVL